MTYFNSHCRTKTLKKNGHITVFVFSKRTALPERKLFASKMKWARCAGGQVSTMLGVPEGKKNPPLLKLNINKYISLHFKMHLFHLQHYNTGIKLRINAQRWVLFFKVLRVNKGAARVRDAVTLNEDVGQ